jgi:hypothetical protein
VRRHRDAALAASALAVLALAVFAEALLSPRVFFQRDILAYWYPGMEAFRRSLAEGSRPLWNPHAGFGAPLLADASFQLAYPPTWLALVLPLAAYYKLFAVSHALWAAAGALVLARRLGLGAAAAAVAGGAFALSGPFLSALSLFHHYAGAAWMPWVLAALESLLRRPGAGPAAVLSLAAGGQLLAGSGDVALATALAAAARTAWHLLRARPAAEAARRLGPPLLLATALAAALGSAQWLPTLEQAARSDRAALGGARTFWSLHPLSLGDLAVPRLVSGAPLPPERRQELFDGRPPLFECVYVGAATLLLAALSGGRLGGRLALAGAGFFLLAALGRHAPLFDALSLLPGFSLWRYPQKLLLPFALFLALAAGFGAASWLRPWSPAARQRGRWAALGLAAAGLALALVAAVLLEPSSALRLARAAVLDAALGVLVAWRASREHAPRAATVLLLAVGGVDLVAVGRTVNPLAPPELALHRPALADALAPGAGRFRVFFASRPDCGRVLGGPAGWDAAARGAFAAVEVLKPPSGVRWGLDGSFDGQFTALEPRALVPFLPVAAALVGEPQGTRLLRAANVATVLLLGPPPGGGLRHVETRATPYDCPLQVLRVEDPVPRAYVVAGERRPAENEVEALLDPAFDPLGEVLLDEARARAAPGPAGAARVVRRTTDTVEVEAELFRSGVLVLVEAWDPGWRVRVDDREATLLRANALFRGVRLDAGRHRVRFAYRPATAAAGVVLAALGALGAAVVLLAGGALKPGRRGDSIAPREEDRP